MRLTSAADSRDSFSLAFSHSDRPWVASVRQWSADGGSPSTWRLRSVSKGVREAGR